jgi:hypothetical protein
MFSHHLIDPESSFSKSEEIRRADYAEVRESVARSRSQPFVLLRAWRLLLVVGMLRATCMVRA